MDTNIEKLEAHGKSILNINTELTKLYKLETEVNDHKETTKNKIKKLKSKVKYIALLRIKNKEIST